MLVFRALQTTLRCHQQTNVAGFRSLRPCLFVTSKTCQQMGHLVRTLYASISISGINEGTIWTTSVPASVLWVLKSAQELPFKTTVFFLSSPGRSFPDSDIK